PVFLNSTPAASPMLTQRLPRTTRQLSMRHTTNTLGMRRTTTNRNCNHSALNKLESQRDSGPRPGVARREPLWGNVERKSQSQWGFWPTSHERQTKTELPQLRCG